MLDHYLRLRSRSNQLVSNIMVILNTYIIYSPKNLSDDGDPHVGDPCSEIGQITVRIKLIQINSIEQRQKSV